MTRLEVVADKQEFTHPSNALHLAINVCFSSPSPLRRVSATKTATTTIISTTATKLRIQQRLLLLFSGERCPTGSIVLVKKRLTVSGNLSVGLPFVVFTLAARAPKSAYQV